MGFNFVFSLWFRSAGWNVDRVLVWCCSAAKLCQRSFSYRIIVICPAMEFWARDKFLQRPSLNSNAITTATFQDFTFSGREGPASCAPSANIAKQDSAEKWFSATGGGWDRRQLPLNGVNVPMNSVFLLVGEDSFLWRQFAGGCQNLIRQWWGSNERVWFIVWRGLCGAEDENEYTLLILYWRKKFLIFSSLNKMNLRFPGVGVVIFALKGRIERERRGGREGFFE